MKPKAVGKLVLSVILIGLAAGVILFHNSSNIGGRSCCYTDQGIVSSEGELVQVITNAARSSASMNFQEIQIWIIFPWILLFLALVVWKRKQFLAWVVLPSLVLLPILFFVAVITNNIGVNRQLQQELPIWQAHFQSAEHLNLGEYRIWDRNNFNDGHSGRITTVDFDYNSRVSLGGNSGRILDSFCLSNCPTISDEFTEAESVVTVFVRSEGLFDGIPLGPRYDAYQDFPKYMRDNHEGLLTAIQVQGLTDDTKEELKKAIETFAKTYK